MRWVWCIIIDMKLEQQVVSPELAKRLDDLGFKQDSLYKWYGKFPMFSEKEVLMSKRDQEEFADKTILSGTAQDLIPKYAAYTVAELDSFLPHGVEMGKDEAGNPWVSYRSFVGKEYGCGDENGANARAKMLIYLLENKLIEL